MNVETTFRAPLARAGLCLLLGALALGAGCSKNTAESRAATPMAGNGDSDSPRARAARTEPILLPAGTRIAAALQSTVSTESAREGDPIELRTLDPVTEDGHTVVPAGSTIDGEVTHAKGAGRIGGAAELSLRFTQLVTPDRRSYPIVCEPVRLTGKSKTRKSVEEIGGGAVGGAILGGILGGGSGAAKGAAVGGVVGTGVAVATKGRQIVLPAGQQMSITLSREASLGARPVA